MITQQTRRAVRVAARASWAAYEIVAWILTLIGATLVGTAIAVTIFAVGVIIEEQLDRPNLAMWTMAFSLILIIGVWVWWICRPPSGKHGKR